MKKILLAATVMCGSLPGLACAAGLPPGSLSLTGSGNENTLPFTMPGPFVLKWKSPDDANPIIQLHAASKSDDTDLSIYGGTGLGQTYIPHGGTFYIEIHDNSDWGLAVVPYSSKATDSWQSVPSSTK
jgi:hypothetical protein